MADPYSPAPAPAQQRGALLYFIYGVVSSLLAIGYGIPLPKLPPPYQPPAQVPPQQPPAPAPAPQPPAPPAPTPPRPQLDPLAAIGRIQFGSAGCTATIIGPQRDDGRWWVLTAAHCVSGVGQGGSMKLRDGRSFPLRVVAMDRRADCCWCLSQGEVADYPNARVALRTPASGARIWHAGFGVDRPGNREDGSVVSGPNGDGQIEMRISVSSGDSGGALVLDETGEVISCVCCTTAKGRVARVWGASPEAIARLKSQASEAEGGSPDARYSNAA